jgi:hypothetical protein
VLAAEYSLLMLKCGKIWSHYLSTSNLFTYSDQILLKPDRTTFKGDIRN